jgi:hypothetical protein
MLNKRIIASPQRRVFVLLLALFAAAVSCQKGQTTAVAAAARLRDFSCLIHAGTKSLAAKEGEAVEVALKVKNIGRVAWSSLDAPPVLLSYHLLSEQKRVVRWDNARTPLPRPVKPGDACSLASRVKAPLEAGRYIVEFDMVREGAAWFASQGSRPLQVRLTVEPRIWPEDRQALSLENGPFTKFDSSRRSLGRLFKLIRLTLGADELSFRGLTGRVSGFRAGADYPQVWLRDAVSIVPVARFLYGKDYLGSWLVEHLAHQEENGSLKDWLDADGAVGKNTTESDQEACAVAAAAQVSRVEGTAWLMDRAAGQTIIDRLEKALQYVLADRLDEATGLVKSAHTIDWGDVDIEDGDERAVAVDERTHWVAGIYSQSMFYQAARGLAAMFEALGQKEKSLFWKVRAESLKRNTDEWLWMKDRGYYRIHRHLDARLTHAFPEDDIFALGGNITAVLTGLADETQAKHVLEQALSRQKDRGCSTAAGVLLPPYPHGVFAHPLVRDPYEYQNGGQWDWFGGKLVLALFQNGYSRQAMTVLSEIAAKDLANGGLFEWDDRQGHGRGSDFFAGSAGSLGQALFEGYFGISLSLDALSLEPHLGADQARIHARLPGTGLFVAYDYRPGSDGRSLTLAFNSNFRGRGQLKVLIPWPARTLDSLKSNSADYEVLLDGRPAEFILMRKNEDEYISLETDYASHRLEIRPGQSGR